jgi:hypothetical protein
MARHNQLDLRELPRGFGASAQALRLDRMERAL